MTLYFAVIGQTISHSLSPKIHHIFAKKHQIELEYQILDVPPSQFEKSVIHFLNKAHGLNVTTPFKHKAFQLAKNVSDRAKIAQAANVLWKNNQGELCADNTDGLGFVQNLMSHPQLTLREARILILGAGGAVTGVLQSILDQEPEQVVILNRTQETAQKVVDYFNHPKLNLFSKDQKTTPYDVIIHGTSATLSKQLPDIPHNAIHSDTWVYDLLYGPASLLLKNHVESLGVTRFLDGLGMLVEQAAESFLIWHQIKPETQTLIAQLRHQL